MRRKQHALGGLDDVLSAGLNDIGRAEVSCQLELLGRNVGHHDLGGTRNPMAVRWPRGITDRGGLRTQFTHVIDWAFLRCQPNYRFTGIASVDAEITIEERM